MHNFWHWLGGAIISAVVLTTVEFKGPQSTTLFFDGIMVGMAILSGGLVNAMWEYLQDELHMFWFLSKDNRGFDIEDVFRGIYGGAISGGIWLLFVR